MLSTEAEEGEVVDFVQGCEMWNEGESGHKRNAASSRRLSLSMKCRTKEGGKETTGEAALRLPSVPFPWFLAVHHQSLAFCARLYDAKNEAPEEEVERNG